MTQNFTIQSSVAIDTANARAELARLSQDYEALRQRIMQPMSVTLNAPAAMPSQTGAAAVGGSATFHLDTDEARRRISQLSQDYETLRQRILQPVAVNIEIPQELQNTAGQQGGQQGTPVALDTTQARQALEQLGQDYDALRQRIMQPIPVTVNAGGGGNGGAPAPVTGGNASSGGVGIFGGIWAGIRRVWSVANVAWSGIKTLLGGVGSFFGFIGRGITSLATTPFRLLTSAIHGVAGAFSLMRTAAQSVMSLLAPAGDLQQRAMNMEVLLDNPAKAKKRLEEIEKYAKETNFSPGELIEASNLMEAFGIHGNDLTRLKLVGNAANAMSKDIREVVTAVNYLGSGRGGEAFEALARIGVTRDKLKPYGVQFNKQGVLLTDTKKALNAVFKYFNDKFKNSTERQATTWKGALQQAAGEVTYALSHGFQGALKPFTNFVRTSIIPAISRIGDSLKKINWEKTLAKPLGTLKKIVDTVSTVGARAIDPDTRGQLLNELKLLGTGLMQSGKLIVGGLLDVGKALLKDLGATLEGFIKNDVFTSLMVTFWNMGKTVLFGFLDAGRLVLSGFSDKFKSDMKMFLEALIPGGANEETERRKNAEDFADRALFEAFANSEFKRVRDHLLRRDISQKDRYELGQIENYIGFQQWVKARNSKYITKIVNSLYGSGGFEMGSYDYNRDRRPVLDMIRYKNGDAVYEKMRDRQIARYMGWTDGSTKEFESMTEGALRDLLTSLETTIHDASMNVSTEHLKAAGEKFTNETLPAAAAPFYAFIGEQQAQAKLKENFNKANEWADKRIKYLDEEIKKKEKEYRKEEKHGYSDTLNSLSFSIGSKRAEKERIERWKKDLDKRYVNASNAQSMRYQQQEQQRQEQERKRQLRPASPGAAQGDTPKEIRGAASIGNIEKNTGKTADSIVILAGAIDKFLTRQDGLEKTLKQVLEVDYA